MEPEHYSYHVFASRISASTLSYHLSISTSSTSASVSASLSPILSASFSDPSPTYDRLSNDLLVRFAQLCLSHLRRSTASPTAFRISCLLHPCLSSRYIANQLPECLQTGNALFSLVCRLLPSAQLFFCDTSIIVFLHDSLLFFSIPDSKVSRHLYQSMVSSFVLSYHGGSG
ncbi:hypothetical protein BDZ91DRAFT_338046 [Kalaharituber pfeilii]|nr:hypothetical protein BDZ91DRAFT_338046 [Kalaharituber pfeilii]